MIIKANNSKPLNVTNSVTYFQKVAKKDTVSRQYPGHSLFGVQSTIQNLYSAGPQKLRIGIF